MFDPEVYSRAGEMQGYALHGHVDLHTWHTHVGSTGTSAQYILPVGVAQPKGQHREFVEAKSRLKCRAIFVAWFYGYLVVTLCEVDFGVNFGSV